MSQPVREALVKEAAACDFIPWHKLSGGRIAITGATGLIGSFIVDVLTERAKTFGDTIDMLILARNGEKVAARFPSSELYRVEIWDAQTPIVPADPVNYVLHLACETSSKGFLEYPVETISSIIGGITCMLDYARKNKARICLASTMEVYASGGPEPLKEVVGGSLDSMNPRNSYPLAKQLAEALVTAYASEFDVQGCVARLCQTFGVGVRHDDQRVFAEFARCCLEERDIVLLTPGEKRNMYISVQDAALAMLLLLLEGSKGTAYNVANESTLCSVREMAQLVANEFGNDKTSVRVEIDDTAAARFRAPGMIIQDTTRLRSLGWRASGGLADIYAEMLASWR